MINNFVHRFQQLISITADGNQTKFANQAHISQSTLNRLLTNQDEKGLMDQVGRVLLAHPTLNADWLLLGEGDMFHNTAPALSAHNGMGEKTGDLLNVVLGFATIDDEDITATTSISEKRLKELRESRSLPTFSELEQLHLHFGINPAYFFTGNETTMYFPDDSLLRVIYALGKQGKAPTRQMVEDIFDVEKDEAAAFLKEWEEYQEKGDSLVLPSHWQDHLQEKYGLYPAWLENGNPPVVDPNPQKRQAIRAENKRLTDALEAERSEKQMHLRTIDQLTKTNALLTSMLERFGWDEQNESRIVPLPTDAHQEMETGKKLVRGASMDTQNTER